jgi:hypothetical protein
MYRTTYLLSSSLLVNKPDLLGTLGYRLPDAASGPATVTTEKLRGSGVEYGTIFPDLGRQ